MTGLAYGIFAAIALALTAVGVWAALRIERQAEERAARVRPIPGTGMWCDAPPDFDVERLARACHLALDCLEPLWHRHVALERLTGWKVKIYPAERWKRADGTTVGGECDPRTSTIQVGPSLGVLAHELAHACESAVDRKMPDEAHASWPQRGITQADTTYRTKWGKG